MKELDGRGVVGREQSRGERALQGGWTPRSAEPGTSKCAEQSASRSGEPSTEPYTSRPSASQSGEHSASSSSTHSELSKMFSWTEKKGKRPLKSSGIYSGGPKRKKLKTWTHTYVCLSSIGHKYIPDAAERTILKMAGLGEKKFGVFAYCTWKEFQEELFREFPKLVEGGGFELLRASDSGGKELVPIDIPHDGYSVEYLQAVVKSKIYIRPLQKDLDESPLEDKVNLR